MNSGGEGRPLKPYRRILEQEIEAAVEELRRPAHGLVLLGIIIIGGTVFALLIRSSLVVTQRTHAH